MASRHKKHKKHARRQPWWKQIPGWMWVVGIGVFLLFGGLIAAAAGENNTSGINPNSPELVAQGQVIYAETCAACHGPEGEGDVGPPLNGSAHAWHHMDNQLRSFVRDGIPGTQMVGHKDHLTDQEIDAVLSFIKTWWTPEQQRMQLTGQHPMG